MDSLYNGVILMKLRCDIIIVVPTSLVKNRLPTETLEIVRQGR